VSLRVVTWNIHKCIGCDGAHRPERIFAMLRQLDADLIGIQEFDSRRRAGRSAVTPGDFGDALRRHVLAAPTLPEGDGFHGNLLLSRWPALQWRQFDLIAGGEPRTLLLGRFDTPEGRLDFGVTHLGLTPLLARRQARRLLAGISPRAATVLAGDFNGWLPGVGGIPVLRRHFTRGGRARTFPSRLPLLSLDAVLATPPLSVEAVSAVNTRASDHRPLVARLRRVPG
jgi:endonuclease/exonuclease/phosphatase family metal-dependent hydrolase